MQYDYASGNDGAGFLICTFNGGTYNHQAVNGINSGNTVRYCVADGNGVLNGLGGIQLYCDSNNSSSSLQNVNIYNNTVLSTGGTNSSALKIQANNSNAAAAIQANIVNNIFYTSGNYYSVNFQSASSNMLKFEGNDYYSSSGNNFNILWEGSSKTSFSSWQSSSGEESLAGGVGSVDPKLVNETVSDLPIGGVAGLGLGSTSPLLGAGLNLTQSPFNSSPYSLNSPYNISGSAWGGIPQDFLNDPIVSGVGGVSGIGAINIGSSLNVTSGTTTIPAWWGSSILTRNFSSINIAAGAKLVFASPTSAVSRMVVIVNSGNFTDSGTLDLGANDMIVHSGSASAINTLLKNGYNSGAWTGTGIDSSAAANDSSHDSALGWMVNGSTYTTWDGQSVVSTDILIKYTYYGDANLSGTVNSADYSLTDNGYLNHLTGWNNGDFNYDGVVNGSDYTLIDNAYNAYTASPSSLIGLS